VPSARYTAAAGRGQPPRATLAAGRAPRPPHAPAAPRSDTA